MDATVTVEEMVAAIGFAARVGTAEPPRRLLAAQQYIIAAESQIAERDAQIANTELMLRKEWWLNHRCPISALYGDDGEMQCNAACCRKDFKREPLEVLHAHVSVRRLAKATEDMTLLEEARVQIAEMRNVIESLTNPICEDCPHRYFDHTGSGSDCDQPCKLCPCEMFEDDMGKMNDAHEAARALLPANFGLTEANDGNK